MDSDPVRNEHAENPTSTYNDWSQKSPQIALPDTQYVNHDCNNKIWTPEATDPLLANLDPFSGLGEQDFDFLLMQDSLMRDNATALSDKSTSQSSNHPMQGLPEDDSSTMLERAPGSKYVPDTRPLHIIPQVLLDKTLTYCPLH